MSADSAPHPSPGLHVPATLSLDQLPQSGRQQNGITREAVLRRELAYMLQELQALREEAEQLRAKLSHAHTVISNHETREKDYVETLTLRERQIADLYASTSWRVTAPLRAASVRLRKSRAVPTPASVAPRQLAASASIDAETIVTAPSGQSAQRPESSMRREMLVAADVLPLFDQHSGGLRLKTLIGLLGEAGWSVTFASIAHRAEQPGMLSMPEGRERYESALTAIGVTGFLYGAEEINRFLMDHGRSLDWAFLSFPAVAEQLMPLVRSHCSTTRIAFDMVDFHGLRLAREAALTNDPELMAEADRQRAVEIACAKSADVTFAVTADEQLALLEHVPEAVVEVLPNVFELPTPSSRPARDRRNVLFVGGFWHKPNGDAMCWFVDRIWPLVRKEAPDAVLRIAGSNPTNQVLALGEQPGVEVLGFVPDLTPLYEQHRVAIAPLRFGAGMKGKVGQSLAYGLPVVATSIGAEGMGLQDGVHVLVSDDESAFATNILRLLRDDALWSRLSVNGRAHIEQTLSIDVVRNQLQAALHG